MLNSYRWTLMWNLQIPRRSQLVDKLNQYESQTMIKLQGKIKFLFSTKVIQICYKCHKLKTLKISKQRVHPYKNRILDFLIKLELTKTPTSCCHHKLLLTIFWNKMPSFKHLDSQTTIVRFLISNQIVINL